MLSKILTLLIVIVAVFGVAAVSVPATAGAADCTETVTYLTNPAPEWDAYRARLNADVTGLDAFWAEAYPQQFGGTFTTPCVYEYIPAEVPFQQTCGVTPEIATSNAFYCVPEHVVMWDGPTFFQPLYLELGDAALTFIVAHEYGHAAQFLSGEIPARSVNREFQADCYAGAYLQYAEEQGIITEEDYREIVAVVAFVGQSRIGSTWFTRTHPTALQREAAMFTGYQNGVAGCQVDFARLYNIQEAAESGELRDAVEDAVEDGPLREAVEEGNITPPERPRPAPRRP
ncbi:MAG: neutral zinc metallopeptidase [Chloroflexota bacterium]